MCGTEEREIRVCRADWYTQTPVNLPLDWDHYCELGPDLCNIKLSQSQKQQQSTLYLEDKSNMFDQELMKDRTCLWLWLRTNSKLSDSWRPPVDLSEESQSVQDSTGLDHLEVRPGVRIPPVITCVNLSWSGSGVASVWLSRDSDSVIRDALSLSLCSISHWIPARKLLTNQYAHSELKLWLTHN